MTNIVGPAGAARHTLAALARPSGALAMVAMDQRESLRTMMRDAGRSVPGDADLVEFKLAVAHALGPHASAFLIDEEFGAGRAAPILPPSCGMILAVDALDQAPGGPVLDTSLDTALLAPDADRHGAVAVKLLLIWRRDDGRAAHADMAREFIRLAAARGMLSVLEVVVRPTERELESGAWDQEAAAIEAARQLSPLGQSLYKVQVPLAGRADAATLERACAELGAAITGPWVVLSQGVAIADFAGAVRAACRGGASGFLAGRAVWSDVVGRPDTVQALADVSVPRVRGLIDLVDREARPWWSA